MKRELAFALEAQSQLTGSLGRTRSSKPHPTEFSTKRSKISTQVDLETSCSIDQTRETGVLMSQSNRLTVYRRNKRFKIGNKEGTVDSVNLEESKGDLVAPISEYETQIEEGSKLTKTAVIEENCEVKNDVPSKVPRRFTRSALKASELSNGNLKLANGALEFGNGNFKGSEGVEDVVVLEREGKENDGVSVVGRPTKKLEMKMSKKVAAKGRPTTVKELFETGLLEGYPVFYNGGKKGILLRGTIKDIGILCSCSLCKGSRVVPPCQFEIHAYKSYRRASQYICLENKKSLLQVIKECRKTSLGTLEETVQSVVGPLPAKESITCRNCMGSFPATYSAKLEQVCDTCMISVKSEASPTHKTGVEARSSKRGLSLKSSTSASVHISSENNSQGKKKRTSSKPSLAPKSPGVGSVCVSSRKKSQWKTTIKSSRPAFGAKSTESFSGPISLQNKSQAKFLKKLSKSASIPKSSKSAYTSFSPKSQWKITKKDLRFHKLVFEEGGLPEGTEVAYYIRGKKLLEGYKKGSGIFCLCCNSEVSPSTFEAHAGWASRRKPYHNIYTSNGVSLHEYAISLLKGRKCAAKDNDDLCIICADGGNLVLCDVCPRAFHQECASLSSIPRGKWYCKYCQNMFQREKFVEHNANAVAAGRVSGVDLIEQITKRCIRIFRNPEEAEVVACVLCRGYDFSKSGFGPRTVILCDQCEKEYHVGCLKKHKMADLKELPKGKWFCCMDCNRIYSALQNLLISGPEKVSNSLLDVIRKKQKDKGLDDATDFDVRWRILSGKIASRETRLLLSQAVSIFHDCFDPIVDSTTGCDFIPSMVYGRNIRGQDYGGMYCAILTVNSSVVSAGILRVFGQDMAELPLVATCNGNQGKGYFQLLFSCIEKLLAILNVRRLVLPAADVAEAIWTDKFGFKKITPEQLSNYRKTCWQMMTFKGTSMLEKAVPECRILNQDAGDISMLQSAGN